VEIKNEAAANAGLSGPQFFLDSVNGQLIDTRWADYIYRTGFSHNHALGFSGGTDQTTYYLSMGYTRQEGMLIGNDFERLTSRLNLDHKLSKRIKVGATVGYTNNQNTGINSGSLPGQAFATGGGGRLASSVAEKTNSKQVSTTLLLSLTRTGTLLSPTRFRLLFTDSLKS
jgi:hypothetical protein